MSKQDSSSESECHILFVEDDADTREMVCFVLERDGYKVTCAPTVAEALELVKQEKFDLYLLDSLLSDGTGVELCQLIRGFDPHTPVVFYSGSAYEADIKKALSAGAQDYLVKPCAIKELEETLDKHLEDAC